jgi:hypothetical protein
LGTGVAARYGRKQDGHTGVPLLLGFEERAVGRGLGFNCLCCDRKDKDYSCKETDCDISIH